jgi:hypothetical protein
VVHLVLVALSLGDLYQDVELHFSSDTGPAGKSAAPG